MRRLICILLLLLVPLHSLATQRGWHMAGKASFSVAHEAAHVLAAHHHHHDENGGLHYDDSADSAKHMSDHTSGGHCIGMPSQVQPPAIVREARADELEQYHPLPVPIPERLHRPPRSIR